MERYALIIGFTENIWFNISVFEKIAGNNPINTKLMEGLCFHGWKFYGSCNRKLGALIFFQKHTIKSA